MKEHQADKTKGTLIVPKKITVYQWLEKWVEDVDIPNHAEITIRSNGNIIKKLVSYLGKIPLQELKPTQIQSYYTNKIRNPQMYKKIPLYLYYGRKIANLHF